MKKKLNVVFLFMTICLILSCSEDFYEENTQLHSSTGSLVRHLTGNDADRIIKILKTNLILLNPDSNSRTSASYGTVEYSKIIEVIDTLGVENYTFSLKNHPEDDFRTFHNLVVNINEQQRTEIHIVEYKMEQNFAIQYRSDLIGFESFRGTKD